MIPNCKELVEYICNELRRNLDLALIGLSGGADSTLTAILCREALGCENTYGVSMPCTETDRQTFNSDSKKLAECLQINHLQRPVANIANAIDEQIFLDDRDSLTALNKGNSRSRARMSVLYGLSHSLSARFPGKRVRVMGTGNLSEDFIGYDTKGGDSLADLFPIGELFKSEVYQLLKYFCEEEIIGEEQINWIPSAGLEPGQTDESDLGYSYAEMEPAIRFCMRNAANPEMMESSTDDLILFVWQRHLANRHKHQAQKTIAMRHLCR